MQKTEKCVSFNGAVTFSLRKLSHSHRTHFVVFRFNGAVTFSLRKLYQEVGARTDRLHCFNGAVTFSLRKFPHHSPASTTSRSFNGAVTFSLRKFPHPLFSIDFLSALQWGRNFFVTEIVIELFHIPAGIRGFNGAVTFSLRKLTDGQSFTARRESASMGP